MYEVWFGRQKLMATEGAHEIARSYHMYGMDHLDDSFDLIHYQILVHGATVDAVWAPLYNWAEVHVDECTECSTFIQNLFMKTTDKVWEGRRGF